MTSSIIFYFSCIFLLYRCLKNIPISLLISSLLISLTPIAEYNIQIILILLSILLGVIDKTFYFSRSRLIIFGVFLIVSYVIISFSFDFEILYVLGKLGKVIAISLPITLSINWKKSLPDYDINKFFNALIIISFLGMLLWFSSDKLDSGILGTYRIPSISSDPNYSAIILISFLFTAKILEIKLKKATLYAILIIILLTQSVSSISCALIIYFSYGFIYKKNNLLFFLLFFSIVIYIIGVFKISRLDIISTNSDWQENYLAMKLNSLYFRMRAQFMGAEMIYSDPSRLLYGFGSGKSLIFFDRVMHNSYMQILFDHGIIFLLSIFVFFNSLLKNNKIYIVIFYLQIMSFMFDSYFMGLIPLFFISFSYLKSTQGHKNGVN